MLAEYQLLPTGESVSADQSEAGPSRNHRQTGPRRLLFPLHLPIARSRLLVLLIASSSILLIGSIIHLRPFSSSTPNITPSDPSGSSEPTGPSRQQLDQGYFQTGDIWEHNDLVSAHLDRCASLGLLRNTSFPSHSDHSSLHTESAYASSESGCTRNSTTLIILSSIYFAEAKNGATFGESIWATSIMTALNRWGYSYMFASLGWYNHDMAKVMEIYQKYKGQVRLVLADPEQVVVAFGEQRGKCLRSEENPEGMEEWRFLGFNFWDTNDPTYGPAYTLPDHPLGSSFTLSPAPFSLTTHFSLPYSVEPTCRSHQHHRVPVPSKPRAYLMAKKTSYLSPSAPSFPYTLPDLHAIAQELDIDIVAGLGEDDDPSTAEAIRESGIVNLGKLGKEEFYNALAGSFALIGAGRPFVSPSPWDGLCMGVPFINPILAWDKNHPQNRTSWKLQHAHMADLDPPHVYSIHKHDHTGLRDALASALQNPFRSFIPPEMTFDAVSNRVAEMVERDWEGEYRRLRRDRSKGF